MHKRKQGREKFDNQQDVTFESCFMCVFAQFISLNMSCQINVIFVVEISMFHKTIKANLNKIKF